MKYFIVRVAIAWTIILVASITLLILTTHLNKHLFMMKTLILIIWVLGSGFILYVYQKKKKINRLKQQNFSEHITNLIEILEKRDSYTAGHTTKVGYYANLIAEQLKLPQEQRETLKVAVIVHDIGKVGIPDSILLKPSSLTEFEFSIIQSHAEFGYDILSKVHDYEHIAVIVRSHHERFNGEGYPDGLKGERIPYLSRILTIADAFDAMTTNRIYRPRLNNEEALIELENNMGSQFDPVITTSALKVLKQHKYANKLENNQNNQSSIFHAKMAFFFKDSLTNAYNKTFWEYLWLEQKQRFFKNKFIYCLQLHNFSAYNQQNSWHDGDILLIKTVNLLQKIMPAATIFRLFGDDFIIVSKDVAQLSNLHTEINNLLKNTNINFCISPIELNSVAPLSLPTLEAYLRKIVKK